MNKINRFFTFTAVLIFALSLATTACAQQQKFQTAAPESCCVYSYWNAAGENDPNSKNEAERLLAEPEVQQFADNMIKRIGKIAPALMLDQSEAKQKLARSIGPKLTNALFKNSGSFFVEEMKFGEKKQLENFQAILLVDAGADAKTLAGELADLFSTEESKPVKVTLSGKEFDSITVYDNPKIELVLGSDNGTLMIGFGEKTVADALQRIAAAKLPGWLTDLQSNKNATRLINFSYANVAKLKDSLTAYIDPRFRDPMTAKSLGLANIESIETCVGFSEEQAFSRVLIRTEGKPKGMLALRPKDELTLDDVRHFPKDSLFAAGSSQSVIAWLNLLEWASDGRLGFREQIFNLREMTPINFSKLLSKLGKKWTIYNGAGDGFLSGMVLSASVGSGKELTSASIDEEIKKSGCLV